MVSKGASAQTPEMTPEIDLSSLEDLKFEELDTTPPSAQQTEDIMTLVTRYRFFQGKNLEQFEKFLRSGDFQRIEQLIIEKFSTQGKAEADELGRTVSKKLLSSMANL